MYKAFSAVLTVLLALPAWAGGPADMSRREEVRRQLRPVARFAGPRAPVQDAFDVEYTLARAADISVTLLDLSRMPLRTFHVAVGAEGTAPGTHRLTLWDGRDSRGAEAPPGEYWAALSFRYADGTVENRRFRVVKP